VLVDVDTQADLERLRSGERGADARSAAQAASRLTL